ncbi:DNA repair protein RadA [Helicobacter sp. MIT 01-3238]|uniref:DNA repair protein RadA n=1 Tax=Helicobacter sp. MIT 01-3238 TaxID=398627 RepID=UPI000E1E3ED3|nr:DNA repair protein RadA [Helicobacter sp. MIT 01-3238]RDU55691.1 DNA repair protein RadA [Helicobacter sp. MIT 01-3238]
MAKKSSLFECQHCGWQTTKWLGKCGECGSWDSLIELNQVQKEFIKVQNSAISTSGLNSTKTPLPITQISSEQNHFFSSFEEELDIVLGGGIVRGGLYLVGGSPGVGKSTLLLKVAGNLAKNAHNVLYVSGEESAGQIRLRAQRLGAIHNQLFLLNEINLDSIKFALQNGAKQVEAKNPNDENPKSEKSQKHTKDSAGFDLCIIDSIQTIYSPNVASAPGSISQVREITFELMRLAKENNISIFIIGHITKEGSIAGPRVLEHMVDCVLYFEGDSSKELRLLRGFKNRFGTTSEIGIFEMSADGLKSAKDASRAFFTRKKSVAGSAVSVILEGSRALVIEIQALVSESYGNPRRQSTGFDSNRLNMLLALLERKLEIPLNRYDVFVNVVGGIKIGETSADLCVVAAIISSFRNRPLGIESAFIGEVSLTGDVREVGNLEVRLKEMQSYGLKKAIVPKIPSFQTAIKCFAVSEVSEVLERM